MREMRKHFSQKGNLDTHKKTVHEGVRYFCGKCGKHISEKGSLDTQYMKEFKQDVAMLLYMYIKVNKY